MRNVDEHFGDPHTLIVGESVLAETRLTSDREIEIVSELSARLKDCDQDIQIMIHAIAELDW